MIPFAGWASTAGKWGKKALKYGDEVLAAAKHADEVGGLLGRGGGNELKIFNSQFGKKVGKHAEDFGLDPSNPVSRDYIRNRMNDIFSKPTEIREGVFRGQGDILPNGSSTSGRVKFYIQGNDVVITDMNNNFITILKDGINNISVSRGKVIWP